MLNSAQIGKFLPHLAKMSLTTSRSQKRDAPSTQDDNEAQFYDSYRKVTEEYDKDFLNKYGGDLDTTLIFVGSTSSFGEHVLTR